MPVQLVPGRVGSVTNSASRGVQHEIVASAGNLGRVGGKFGRTSERFWTCRRREVWTRRLEYLDASEVNLFSSAKELSPSWYSCGCGIVADATNNYEFGRVGVISRMTPRRTAYAKIYSILYN